MSKEESILKASKKSLCLRSKMSDIVALLSNRRKIVVEIVQADPFLLQETSSKTNWWKKWKTKIACLPKEVMLDISPAASCSKANKQFCPINFPSNNNVSPNWLIDHQVSLNCQPQPPSTQAKQSSWLTQQLTLSVSSQIKTSCSHPSRGTWKLQAASKFCDSTTIWKRVVLSSNG